MDVPLEIQIPRIRSLMSAGFATKSYKHNIRVLFLKHYTNAPRNRIKINKQIEKRRHMGLQRMLI